jgi:WD40 repeat protein
VAFSSDSQRLFVAAGEWNRPTTISSWNVTTGTVETEESHKHTGEVLTLALSRDGTSLAAGGADRSVAIWNIGKRPGP